MYKFFHLCKIDRAIDFLTKRQHINKEYSKAFNTFFPNVLKVFNMSENNMNLLEKKYFQVMSPALDDLIKFKMNMYYECLKNILDDYNIYKLYVLLLIDHKYDDKDDNTDKLIGCATISLHINKKDVMISNVLVTKEYQRQGYGKKIIEHIKKKMKKKGFRLVLEVNDDNIPALKCYKSCGFTISRIMGNKINMECVL